MPTTPKGELFTSPSRYKIRPIADLAIICQSKQRLCNTIVLANGCFDVMHPGHIYMLQWAAAQGTNLVVAVNSDASVRALKGPTRPIIPLEARMDSIAALECVDAVVSFDATTATELILLLRPDVVVKGSEYAKQPLPERDAIMSYGGLVALSPTFPGYSTSTILTHSL